MLNQLLWRMSHDPYSESETRCRVFQRASNVLRDISFCDTPQIFPRSWQDLQSLINTLPRTDQRNDGLNYPVIQFSNKLNTFIQNDKEVDLRITQTKVKNLQQNIQTGFLTMPEEFQKKFSGIISPAFLGLTLNLLLSVENFLCSKYDYFLFLEDDVFLPNSFISEVTSIVASLPKDFDVFSFIVPDWAKGSFKEWMRLSEKSVISISYQAQPMSCILFSRSGAAKLLHRYFEANFEKVKANYCGGADHKIYNFHYTETNETQMFYFINHDEQLRTFKTYTYVPEYPHIVFTSFDAKESTWNPA